jgi:hypothetical protein
MIVSLCQLGSARIDPRLIRRTMNSLTAAIQNVDSYRFNWRHLRKPYSKRASPVKRYFCLSEGSDFYISTILSAGLVLC